MKHRFVIEWRQVDYVVGNRKIANTGKFFGGDVLCGGISNIYASCKEEAVEIFRGCNHIKRGCVIGSLLEDSPT